MGRYLVEIKAVSLERLHDLQRIFDIDVARTTSRHLDSGFIVEALVSEAEVEQLRREGYELKTIQDAEEVGRQRRKEME
jgi:phosphoribosyl-dephospho-CoA transferase